MLSFTIKTQAKNNEQKILIVKGNNSTKVCNRVKLDRIERLSSSFHFTFEVGSIVLLNQLKLVKSIDKQLRNKSLPRNKNIYFYTSTKSWKGYIFIAVYLCVCLSVYLSVRVCVCVCLSANKIPAERMHRF